MSKKITATQIKKLAASGKAIVGTEKTMAKLKLGKIDQVILSSNCPQKIVDDINYYASMSGTEVVVTSHTNEELGVICKKPFAISVLSVNRA